MGVAVVWLGFFKLNALVFSQFEHSPRAHWIFLPAALRVLSVLVFEDAGVVGLVLGAYLTLSHGPLSDLPYELGLALTSGIAPLAAIWLCRRMFLIRRDLSGLQPLHIVLLSITGAVANSLILNGYLAAAGRLKGDWVQLVTILVGDMLGTAIMLFVITTALSLVWHPKLDSNSRC